MPSARMTASSNDLADLLPSWQRHLRSANKSPRTLQSYAEAVGKLIDFLASEGLPTAAAQVGKEHVEAFVNNQLARHKPATAALRYRSLQQFFRWAEEEGEIPLSPMIRMKPPKVQARPVPIIEDDALVRLLAVCDGPSFEDVRDLAMLRVLIDTGCRRAELTGMAVSDIDLDRGIARVVGKGNKERIVPLGANTVQALDRYLRARGRHTRSAGSDFLWLAMKGRFTEWGVAQMLDRRTRMAGLEHIHPHQFRHTAAHQWLKMGGNEGDAMQLFGWSSRDMLTRYGASAAAARALDAHRRLAPGDRV